jgi:hypothetical protein
MIPAILSLLCAANWSAASISQPANPLGGDGLSPLSANPAALLAADPIQAVLKSENDSSWMLQDDRHRMSDHAARADTIVLPTLVSLNSVVASAQPTVDSPDIVEFHSPDVNELTVPVPVFGIGWVIVLFAVMFQIGARMLRFRRVASR